MKKDNTYICRKEADIAILEANQANMMQLLKNIDKKIDTFIEKSNKNYATKKELFLNEKRIEKIENIFNKILWIIISTIVLAVLSLIIKTWYV